MIPHPTRPFSFNAQQITLGLDVKMTRSHTILRGSWSLVTARLPQDMLRSAEDISQKSSFITLDTAQSTTHDGTNGSVGGGHGSNTGHFKASQLDFTISHSTTITPLLREEGRYCSLDTIIQVSVLWDPWH